MSLSDEEKIRLLEKRIIKLEEMVARGARAQYLFCPSLDCWLPAQCDPEGRQVIDPTDLDTRYHKKGEDLNLETHYLIQEYFRLKSSAAYGMIVRKGDDSDYYDILCKNLRMTGVFVPALTSTGFMTAAADKYINFSGFSAGNLELMRIMNQYVKLPNLPAADPGVLDSLYKDAGSIKISAGP